ncbi:hypothetical protein NE865_01819 [Phthorimaea operculella]|nr:hypothetical protein NE865_01819 [Phthorimaea operculella]
MPVMKNDWDIYNSRSRKTSENTEKVGPGGRVRKVSESRSEGPAMSPRQAALSPHRSAPAMRSLSYCRAPPSRASLRQHDSPSKGSASPPGHRDSEKFHSRARAESPERGSRGSRCSACMPYL